MDYFIERKYSSELRQNDECNTNLNKVEDKTTKEKEAEGVNIVDAIVQDLDLSIAHSTLQKSLLEKDPDISLDGEENIGISVRLDEKEALNKSKDFYSEDITENVDKHKEEKNAYSPPPLSEISVPISHDYGYGYYLKPLWNIDSKERKMIKTRTESIRRIQKLVNEGRKRRKQKELIKMVSESRMST